MISAAQARLWNMLWLVSAWTVLVSTRLGLLGMLTYCRNVVLP